MNIELFKDKSIVICENNYKDYYLKFFNKEKLFFNVKFYTKKEFFSKYLFGYNDKSIIYLMEKYNLKYNICKIYLDNLMYIDEDKEYDNNKINMLKNIKIELINNNLLIFDDLFKDMITDYNIYYVGYPYLDNLEENIFNLINAKSLETKEIYKESNVYIFNNIYEESSYVVYKISELINKGININDIKICNIDNDYNYYLDILFSFYNIPIKLNNDYSLYDTYIFQEFIKSNDLVKFINDSSFDEEIINKIVNLYNKYIYIDNDKILREILSNNAKNIKISNFNYKNYVEVVDINYPFNDEYVFIMNFNNDMIPLQVKDENYITDNIKNIINMKSTNEINKELDNFYLNKINSIKNKIITLKKVGLQKEVYPSKYVNILGLNVINESTDIYESYSLIHDKLKLGILLDNFYKYNTYNEDINVYLNSFDTSYNTYDNKFNGINLDSLNKYIKNNIKLSYSSLNNFNKCQFRYYLANILHLDIFEERFASFIGTLFHDILSKANSKEEIDSIILEYLNNNDFTNKQRFFINKIGNDIKFVFDFLNDFNEHNNLKDCLKEKELVINNDNNNFVGFIDKIYYKKLDKCTLVSVLDYKTGNSDIDIKYLKYGFNMQLPIYLYLIKNSNLFENPIFVGFYLEYILNNDILIKENISYEDQKKNNLKFVGYSNSDINLIEDFDNTYEDSNFIKGLKLKKDGNFSSYSKVLSNDEINKVISFTEKNIENAFKKIKNGEFNINPKRIDGNNVSCLYCPFKDICFVKEEDYINLEEPLNSDFLKDGDL